MKLFTVRDFIAYNNPCFSCGEKIIFTFGIYDPVFKPNMKSINPVITPTHTILDVKIAYRELVELSIEHVSNKIEISNLNTFKLFLKNNDLTMSSQCSQCGILICSESLSLNLDNTRFNAVKISNERLMVTESNCSYRVYTTSDKSDFSIFNTSTGRHLLFQGAPPLYLYKIKSKEKLIEKLKLYLVFS